MALRTTIDWELDGDRVSGALTAGDAPARPFSGWLELLSLLQATLAPPEDDPTPTTPQEEP